MSMKEKTLHVYLGELLKKSFKDYCEDRGVSATELVKKFIESEVRGGNNFPSFSALKAEDSESKEAKTRFEILLTESEKQAMSIRADHEGCSMRRWVIDAIRASLTQEPQLQMKEIEELGESNYQLLAIGRNLNQIAKAMNEGKKDSVSIAAIESLRAEIKSHVENVDRLIRANVERWKIQ